MKALVCDLTPSESAMLKNDFDAVLKKGLESRRDSSARSAQPLKDFGYATADFTRDRATLVEKWCAWSRLESGLGAGRALGTLVGTREWSETFLENVASLPPLALPASPADLGLEEFKLARKAVVAAHLLGSTHLFVRKAVGAIAMSKSVRRLDALKFLAERGIDTVVTKKNAQPQLKRKEVSRESEDEDDVLYEEDEEGRVRVFSTSGKDVFV